MARSTQLAADRCGDAFRGLGDRPRARRRGLRAAAARISSGGHSGRRAGDAGRSPSRAARAEEAFDALRSAAPACRRRHGIALYGVARADIAPRAHEQCGCGDGVEQSTWTVLAILAGVDAFALLARRGGGAAPMLAARRPLSRRRSRFSRRCVAGGISRRCVVRAAWPCSGAHSCQRVSRWGA